MDNRECCGTCKYNRYEGGEFYCDNPESEYYVCPTEYKDTCEEYEGK